MAAKFGETFKSDDGAAWLREVLLHCALCYETNRCRVSQRCHHLDVCWSQLVNYKEKSKYIYFFKNGF